MVANVLLCIGRYLLFIVPVATFLLALRQLANLPNELFRKMLHCAAFLSAPIVMCVAPSWEVATAALVIFALAAYPFLVLAERWRGFSHIFAQRSPGEIKRSLWLCFGTGALLCAVCWGAMNRRWIAVSAILMWGLGDAAAALVGTRLGKHRCSLPFADAHKTWEGAAAMFVVSFVVGAALLALGVPDFGVDKLWLPLLASVVGAYVEVVTHSGYDTVTCPVAIAAALATGAIGIGL